MECPACGKYEFPEKDSYDICPVCGWEDDGLQDDDHNYAGGANSLSVNEARLEFFLLRNSRTREAAAKLQQEFESEDHKITAKYAGTNYVEHPEMSVQSCAEFRASRKQYMNSLNHILQSTNDNDIE